MWGCPGTGLDDMPLSLKLSKAAIYAGATSIVPAPLSHASHRQQSSGERELATVSVADDLYVALISH